MNTEKKVLIKSISKIVNQLNDDDKWIKTGSWKPTPFYNGGWVKTVTGLDKSKTNGYSIVGDFIELNRPQYIEEGTILLVCDISGSRKHQKSLYTLLRVTSDGLERPSDIVTSGSSWAIDLWESIETHLNSESDYEDKPEPEPSEIESLKAELAQLKKENEELKAQNEELKKELEKKSDNTPTPPTLPKPRFSKKSMTSVTAKKGQVMKYAHHLKNIVGSLSQAIKMAWDAFHAYEEAIA